jgi:hypothetical protein
VSIILNPVSTFSSPWELKVAILLVNKKIASTETKDEKSRIRAPQGNQSSFRLEGSKNNARKVETIHPFNLPKTKPSHYPIEEQCYSRGNILQF